MKQGKKRLAVFLCLLLAIPTLISALPMASLTARAAGNEAVYMNVRGMYWNDGDGCYDATIEVGQTAHLGDFLYYSSYSVSTDTYKSGYLSQVSGETYSVNNKSVLTLKSDGTFTTKARGKATITVKYKGNTLKCRFNVVAKGKCGSTKSSVKKINAEAQKVIKAYGSKITSSNRYKLAQACGKYSLTLLRGLQALQWNSEGYFVQYNNGTEQYFWIAPLVRTANNQVESLNSYAADRSPIGTAQAKWFQISNISGKANSKTVTMTLKKKVTATDIFALKVLQSDDTFVKDDGEARFRLYLKAESGEYFCGTAIVKEGSNKLTLTMDFLKLKKGKKYRLCNSPFLEIFATDPISVDWTKHKSFTAK